MKIWLLPQDKFVKINNLKPVTNATSFEKGMVPTEDGLFSNEIFGMNIYDRRHNWAYIDLKRHFITPKAYITLKALNRNFEAIVFSTKSFKIVNGVLEEDESGGTGIEWLYKNWEQINFQKNDSTKRSRRIDMITTSSKDDIFITKWAVMPAFYRDVNLQNNSQGRPKIPEINDLYSALIRNVSTLETANDYDFMLNAVVGKTQSTLVDIYNLIKDKVNGKNGYLRKAVMGKSVDYGSRIVITASPYESIAPEEQKIDFYHTGVPLSFCCAQLTPFVVWWTKNYFKTRLVDPKNQFPIINDAGKQVIVHLDNPEIAFGEDYINKCITRWINNPSCRFDKIELPIVEEDKVKFGIKSPKYLTLVGYKYTTTTLAKKELITTSKNSGELVQRHLTWTDILYMATVDVSEDKHVVITRYPVLDYFGSFTSRIHVLSTRYTAPVIINDKLYDSYPQIDLSIPRNRVEATFIDSYKISPLYLPGIGGDHDGDQITSKIVFTKEANEEAERIMTSKSNLLTIDGGMVRKIGNEAIQTLYALTRFH